MSLAGTVIGGKSRGLYNDRALSRCARAKELEDSGDYEGAARALGESWRGVGERPRIDGLSADVQPQVLLRVGVLSGWLGGLKQIEGSQERAKDLISESLRLFEALKEWELAAEAQTELGFIYWREGAHDEARVQFSYALKKLSNVETVQKVVTILRIAAVEMRATRYLEALRLLLSIARLVEDLDDHALKGRFYNSLGIVRKNLGAGTNSEDVLDAAMVDFEAALYHFGEIKNARFQAYTLNNLGFVNFLRGNFEAAHGYLNRARRLFTSFGDEGSVGQVDETRARAYLAQNLPGEAERVARAAVKLLERGEQRDLLAEAMVIYGMALARLNKTMKALDTFQEAARIAAEAGDREGAGRASLALIESLGDTMTAVELNEIYLRAEDLLRKSQQPEIQQRLITCARRVIAKNRRADAEQEIAVIRADAPIILRDEVLRYEGQLIRRALRLTGNRLRRAAGLLGMKHQTLSQILKERHRTLLTQDEKPTPPKRNLVRAEAPVKPQHHK